MDKTLQVPCDLNMYMLIDPQHKLWFIYHGNVPHNSGITYDQFVERSLFKSIRRVRLPGIVSHGPEIVDLYRRKLLGEIDSVQICSPFTSTGQVTPAQPLTSLQRLRVVQAPPSLGGWHEV